MGKISDNIWLTIVAAIPIAAILLLFGGKT
jgi:hypothetical protein